MLDVQGAVFTCLTALLPGGHTTGKAVLLFTLPAPIPSKSPPAEVGTAEHLSSFRLVLKKTKIDGKTWRNSEQS